MRMSIAIAVLFCANGSFAFAESKIQQGLWKVTTTMEMKGLPIKLPAVTTQQCFDKDNPVPRSVQQNDSCDVSQKLINESTISWTLACVTDRGDLTGNGEITYKGDTFKGFLKLNLGNKEGKLSIDNTLQGQFLGACKKV